jgi:apolipoprotein D and lipocalin family protein
MHPIGLAGRIDGAFVRDAQDSRRVMATDEQPTRPAARGRTFALLAALGLGALALTACDPMGGPVGNRVVPQPAKPVELGRYTGLWYELARYDNRFERGCEAVTAEYRRQADGAIQVINSCRQGGPDGPVKTVKGRAKVVAGSGSAKLKVSFFGPFFGDYWVLDHAPDYSWSIVGEPSGRYLWLLSRTAKPPVADLEALYARVRALGYDAALIRPTRQ